MQNLLSPSSSKYGNSHWSFKGVSESSEVDVFFKGQIRLLAVHGGVLTNSQINSMYSVLQSLFKNEALIYLNLFPDLPSTSNGSEVSMGNGNGNLDSWCCSVPAGNVIFEINVLHPLNLNHVKYLKNCLYKSSLNLSIVTVDCV